MLIKSTLKNIDDSPTAIPSFKRIDTCKKSSSLTLLFIPLYGRLLPTANGNLERKESFQFGDGNNLFPGNKNFKGIRTPGRGV